MHLLRSLRWKAGFPALKTHARELTADLRAEWRPVVVLVLIALAVHAALWWVFPPHLGPDGGAYSSYYIDVFESKGYPIGFTNVMHRMPLAPLLQTIPLTISLRAYEVVQTLLATLAVGMVYFITLPWGRWTGVAAALVYLGCLPVQVQFHQFGVDSTFTLVIIAACLAFRYALVTFTLRAWGLTGVMIGLTAMTRPNGLIFSIFLAGTLLAGGSLRRKVYLAAVLVAMTALTIAPWQLYKGLRYDQWSFARGGFFLFYSVFSNPLLNEALVNPENGEASAQLAELVQEYLLPQPNYTAYDITLEDFFGYHPNRRNYRFLMDACGVVDTYVGWETDYQLLGETAIEAIRAHPGAYFYLLKNSFVKALMQHLVVQPAPSQLNFASIETSDPNVPPLPSENELIAAPVFIFWNTRPNDLPPPSPQQIAWREVRLAELHDPLLTAQGSEAARNLLDTLWTLVWLPQGAIYLLAGIALLANRRKSLLYLLLTLIAAVGTTTLSAVVHYGQRYRMPVESIFLVSAVIGARYLLDILLSGKLGDFLTTDH